MEQQLSSDTIAAVSTPAGVGGIAVIRISGPDAIGIVDSAWRGKSLKETASHSAHLGKYVSTQGEVIDEGIATLFLAPNSFTGEDTVELSVHGSRWIQKELLADLVRRGIRVAEPGEFTRRAFFNGKLDLAQAEGVADLIAASSKAAHAIAISQTAGRFSKELDNLRDRLIEFASLLELELDFSEEDVEFADRSRLLILAQETFKKLYSLANSYNTGAVIKDGVPVVIAGVPNAGKSSLLNLLLHNDKAIVSDIPGTTRDVIEDTIEIDGILYRFFDTAGLRCSDDEIEKIGIERARNTLGKARIVIWVFDPTVDAESQIVEINEYLNSNPDKEIIIARNKTDLLSKDSMKDGNLSDSLERNNDDDSKAWLIRADEDWDLQMKKRFSKVPDKITFINMSTKTGEGIDLLKETLKNGIIGSGISENDFIVTNARHYEALTRGIDSLKKAIEGIDAGISADFIAQDIRETLHHIGTITGTITTDDLLHSIFSRFCIGK